MLTPLAVLSLLRGWTAPLGCRYAGPPAAEVAGLLLYAVGTLLMCWARGVMRGSSRLGAVPPRDGDRLVSSGPFRAVRHPMYSAVLATSLGLGLAVHCWLFYVVAAALLATFTRLIPVEEGQLPAAYGADYDAYSARTRRLVPFVY